MNDFYKLRQFIVAERDKWQEIQNMNTTYDDQGDYYRSGYIDGLESCIDFARELIKANAKGEHP